jgi:hypothetical protein
VKAWAKALFLKNSEWKRHLNLKKLNLEAFELKFYLTKPAG